MAAQAPTPSSEIIHTVSAFTDALDSLPPALTRSLSDLKELDAVLNSSLQSITSKLKRLHDMMHSPEPGSKATTGDGEVNEGGDDDSSPKYTPLDRLKLLREVAEDARVFRLGGEDKIRVATNTCETISTHNSHLSTLSTLLLGFLPPHLLPHLPAPSAPHGYPQSNTSLRGRYDYSAARHPGQGSTSRLSGALGMVREHYDLTRSAAGGRGAGAAGGGAGGPKKRAAQIDYSIYGDDYAGGSRAGGGREGAYGAAGAGGGGANKDPTQRHPNQYTKKRLAAQHHQQGLYGGASPVLGGGGGAVSAAATNAAAGVYQGHQYQYPSSAVEGGKGGRRAGEGGYAVDAGAQGAGFSAAMAAPTALGNGGSRPGSSAAGQAPQAGAYYAPAGAAGVDEYGMSVAVGGGRGGAKRKPEEMAGGNKRRKKGAADSPDPAARTLPLGSTAASRAPRRQNSNSTARGEEPLSPLPASAYAPSAVAGAVPVPGYSAAAAYGTGIGAAGVEEEYGEAVEGDDEQDKTLYCFCQRVSFGEMIACDAPDCEHEWFHLPCVGLKSIPDGRWFCDECKRTLKAGKKGRR
ncbi:hypothetical protein JCM8097_001124 [Rhodosporidiobolus ruineniae]